MADMTVLVKPQVVMGARGRLVEQRACIWNVRNDIGSMWRVDWYEIAASWLRDYPEDEEA